MNSYGCFPLGDSNQDKRTCKCRQTRKYPDEQLKKAKVAANSKLETGVQTGYLMQNASFILHTDDINTFNKIQCVRTSWCTNGRCFKEAAVHLHACALTLDHLSQGNLTTFRGSYQFVGHKALCDRWCRV